MRCTQAMWASRSARARANTVRVAGGFDQQALFLLEGELGTLDLHDLMQPFGLGQRSRDAGRSRADTTLVAAGGVEVVLDLGEAHCDIDLPVRAHWQALGHQLRDSPFGQADACGEGGLGLGAVEFSHFRPLTLVANALRSPAYELAREAPPRSRSLPIDAPQTGPERRGG